MRFIKKFIVKISFILIAVLLVFSVLPVRAHARSQPLEKGAAVEYSIRVSIDPEGGTLAGQARIELPAHPSGGKWLVHVAELDVLSATLNGKALKQKDGHLKAKRGTLIVNYEISGGAWGSDPSNPGVVSGNLISPEGVSLTGYWYPAVEDAPLAYYSLKAVLPHGFEAVSEAEDISVTRVDGKLEFSFLFPYPATGLTLAAGPYKVFRAEVAGVDVYGYFLPEDEGLAEEYVREAARYIELYTVLLGKFPYTRFSVVENVLPTGYSMPTYTLLGRDVLRLPFILKTSLGHETLHQWFGSGVYVDRDKGNWSEGLTAYLADHYFDEIKGKGQEHRKRLMLDFKNYVHSGKDFPLEDFRSRTDRATRSVGYGKGALVFHMLRREIGDTAFFGALRNFASLNRFSRASWLDIKASAEEASGSELGWFFDQWVARPGHIRMYIQGPTYLYLGGRHLVRFTLKQEGRPYRFKLPVVVYSGVNGVLSEGAVLELVEVEGEKTVVEIESPGIPKELVIDPDYDLIRNLSERETPPTWSGVMGAKRKVVVIPTDKGEAEVYAPLVEALTALDFEAMAEDQVSLALMRKASVVVPGVIPGRGLALLNRLYGGDGWRAEDAGEVEGFSLKVLKNPLATRLSVALVSASDSKEAARAARKLSHYGRYTALSFEGGRNTGKSTDPSEDGIRHEFETTTAFVRTEGTLSINDVMEEIESRDVIYLGESHTRFGDHKLQLEVIRWLVERGHKVAVGMEMFEPKGQAALDDYVKGSIGEGEFLKRSKYYDSWGMNYHLYREILDYARQMGLPVLGLNQDKETVKKVSRSGLGSLNKEELARVPEDMDLSDHEYRDRLKSAFFSHNASPSRDFASFYQAQVLRDEAMAHNIAGFMEQNPGHKVVVVVGQGHVAYGSGIPERVKRLNGSEYSILVNADSGSVDPEMADYVFHPPDPPVPETAVIGVSTGKAEGGVNVMAVRKGSPAEHAGLKEGDLIVAVGKDKVSDISELKIAFFLAGPGQETTITVLRKRLFFGPRVIVYPITLP